MQAVRSRIVPGFAVYVSGSLSRCRTSAKRKPGKTQESPEPSRNLDHPVGFKGRGYEPTVNMAAATTLGLESNNKALALLAVVNDRFFCVGSEEPDGRLGNGR